MPFDYNCTLLVQLVEKYPCIWNRGDLDYRNKTAKDRSWAEITRSLEPNFNSFSETKQIEIENTLRDKWSNIRDTMVRYLRQRCTKPLTKRYHYADACHFLEKMYSRPYDAEAIISGMKMSGEEIEFEPSIHNVMCVLGEDGEESGAGDYIDCRVKTEPQDDRERSMEHEHRGSMDHERRGSMEREQRGSMEHERRGSTSEEEPHPPPRKKPKTYDIPETNLDSRSHAIKGPDPDEDEAFFISVLPHVRSLSQDEKLDFRMGILQMIKDAKKRNSPSANS